MKFTPAQQRASEKLTAQWQCAYSLQESLSTLEGLVRRGVAEIMRHDVGSMFSPHTSIFFRRKSPNAELTRGEAVALNAGVGLLKKGN